MKLLYFYFDFTQNGANPEGYRGFKICELNFGTKSQYHMEPPTQARPTYLLTQEERPEGGRIVPGFWGDERIYNVSALVGDNGSGKSMLIHEMIRCLMTSFHEHMAFEKLEEPQYPFVFVTEGVYGELYLVNFHIAPEVSFFSKEWKRISLPIDQKNGKMISLNWGLDPPKPRKEYGVLRKSKMIYFSNAITMSDKAQYDYWNYYEVVDSKGYSINTQYVSPLYDCSLIADMSEAVKTSKAGINSLDKHLNTYFNFRSYQEARYVFDRNQRKILLDLRDKHKLPVPLPKLLKLKIINPFLLNKMLFSQREISQKDAFSNFYNNDFFDTNAQRIAAALSMNCLMAYCAIETRGYFDYIWNCAIRESEHLQANTFFSRLLTLCKAENRKRSSNYFKICQNYIQFLWRNIELIDIFVKPTSVRLNVADDITVEIPLGDILDSQLEEFLIHFITLTRAVSKNQYFVIYNWGLSSGESNLLHMFTKLWYALSVNSFNNEKYIAKITEQSAKEICNINQEKKLLTTTDNKTMQDCDSVILFIDEADLTYHPEWQRQFVSIITEFLPRIFTDPYYAGSGSGCKDIQIILSTHSPLILGDFPAASVTYLRRQEDGTNQIDNCRQVITFGENLYTILRDSFYLKNGAVGEFARRKIEQVLNDTSRIRQEAKKEKAFHNWTDEELQQAQNCLDTHEKKTVQYLAHGIIRSKLEEEINNCRRILHGQDRARIPQSLEATDYQARIQQLKRENELLESRISALKRKSEASE